MYSYTEILAGRGDFFQKYITKRSEKNEVHKERVMKDAKHNCYGCANREPGCHAACEDYKRFAQAHKEYKKLVHEAKAEEALKNRR